VTASKDDHITRTPVLASGYVGVWSTNISMLPSNVFDTGATANDLHSIDVIRKSALGDANAQHYVLHPLSSIGDGLPHTVFRSLTGRCSNTSRRKASFTCA
jgi:hypothetical protein